MLIDWISAYLPMDELPRESWDHLVSLTDRIRRFCPKTGEVQWESAAWESVRSDSHQIAFRVTGDAVFVQGSPARVCGSGDAVFGEGPSAALDLVGCLHRMIQFVSVPLGVQLPTQPEKWKVSRIDVTGNLLLDDLPSVRVALRTLRECEGGRYRVSQQAGDTVYWSHKSRLRSGKAYAKGPHIDYQLKQKDYTGRAYTVHEREMINRLLRLELKLGAQWLRERAGCPWYALDMTRLTNEWREYFERMIGDADMTTYNVQSRIEAVAETPGQAKAAYSLFLLIQSRGWQEAREVTNRATWYRNIKVLHLAGLGDADISAGNVVQLRRKVLTCQLVNTWAEFSLAA